MTEAVGTANFSKDGSRRVTDERFNTASHLASAVMALMGTVLLIVKAAALGKPWQIVSFSLYGVSLMSLFVASILHHGIRASPKVERRLRLLDYEAIFLFIAGTMTPACLVLARGTLGWSVFGVVWAVAIGGMAVKGVIPGMPKYVTNTLFLTLGWMALMLIPPVYRATSWPGLTLLAAGGACYTLGVLVFAAEKPNPVPGKFGFHELWHILVSLGALAHYMFMYLFVLPA